jgi:hypothetical protein
MTRPTFPVFFFFSRNIQALQIEYTKACKTFLVTRACALFFYTPQGPHRFGELTFLFLYSNIVTHHAEDGSGVGSAIIAGLAKFILSSKSRSAHERVFFFFVFWWGSHQQP